MSEFSEQLRAAFKAGDDVRDAGLTTPEDVVRADDIVYGGDPRWQVLDLYRPRSAEGETLPVIVSVHGGGWVYGDKERYQFYCMDLARRGFAVVNFTYRLAPDHKYPAPLEDTNLVFAWVQDNAARHGLDRSRVFAVGDSAGANILGLYAAICTNPAYAALYDFRPPEGFAPRAVALNCGAYVQEIRTGMGAALMGDYLPGGGTAEELERLNVTAHITPDYPPVFLMTAVDDMVKEQAPLLAAALTARDVPFIYRLYGDKTNRLAHVFHCNIRSEAARVCNDEECAFFREFL